MTAEGTVLAAIRMATKKCRPPKKGAIFHSDRGVKYAATCNMLKSHGFIQIMSRKGNCWDKATSESYFKSLKSEWIYGYKTKTMGQ